MDKKIERRSLTSQVYTLLLKKIQDGSIAQGERLNIENIAKEFGVSRTPIREAINKLTQDGLVEQIHNVGPRVINLSALQMFDIIETNTVLLHGIIDSLRTIEDVSPLVEELNDVLLYQKKALDENLIEDLHKNCTLFHVTLISFSPNEKLKQFALQTQLQFSPPLLFFQKDHEYVVKNFKEHIQITELLKNRDFENLKILIKSHNDQAKNRFEAYLQNEKQ